MMNEQITQEYIYGLAVSLDGGTQFSAQSSGLYRSMGQGWRRALAGLAMDPFAVTAVTLSPHYASDGTVLAGASGAILRSVDGGDSWQVVALPAPPPVITALAFARDYARSGIVYAATLEDGVWVSQDRGMQWEVWNFGLIGLAVNALAVAPDDGLYAGTELGVFQSKNRGRSWVDVALFEAPVTALALAGTGLLVGTEGLGLWQLGANGRMVLAPETLSGTVEAIVCDGSSRLVLCDNALWLSRDEGSAWQRLAPEMVVTACTAPGGLAPGMVVLAAGEEGNHKTFPCP